MKATKILQLLNEGKLDDLRRACELEVMSEKPGNLTPVKAREKLAKIAAKENKVKRPELAGAFEKDGYQIITDGYFFAKFDDIVPGLPVPPTPGAMFEPRLDKGEKVDISIDLAELSNLAKIHNPKDKKDMILVGIKKRSDTMYIQAKYIIDALPALTGKVTYRLSDYFLRIEGDNGFVVILKVRPWDGIPKTIKTYEVKE